MAISNEEVYAVCMKIKKFGHCCLLLEVNGPLAGSRPVRFLTDPGTFTTAQNELTDIDAVLITHEHGDHFHIESLKKILENNPSALVIANSSVGALLKKEGIIYTKVADGDHVEVKGVLVEGSGKDHEIIYGTMGLVENTGYFVAEKFFFPGDAFHLPGKSVDVLALPVAGPWMKMSQAIEYAKAVGARTAFGVHDGMIVPSFRGFIGRALDIFVPETSYIALADGETKEF